MTWRELLQPDYATDFTPAGPSGLRWRILDRYDKAALLFLALVGVTLLASCPKIVPGMSDTWYHLAVARQVYQRSEIPEWANWEFAPVGRPHLYPPLLHVILALLAVPFRGDFVAVGSLMAAGCLLLSLLTCWLAARRLFGAAVGFLALLLLSMDLANIIILTSYIPSGLVNIMLPLLVLAFLQRRAWVSIALLTAMYYAHLGLPHLVALGLVLFALKYRRYARLTVKVVVVSVILYAPFLARLLLYHDWLSHFASQMGLPGGMLGKLMSLQILHLIILPAAVLGLWRRDRRNAGHQLPAYLLIGLLPLLFTYGGRYYCHTVPLWVGFAALGLRRLVPALPRARRLVALSLCTFLPLPALTHFKHLRVIPSFTTTDICLVLALRSEPLEWGEGERLGTDCRQVAAWLSQHTAPEEIIFVNREWVAGMVTLFTGHPTDFGAWWEVGKPQARREVAAYRASLRGGVFVYIPPKKDTESILGPARKLPGVDEQVRFGRFVVGRRRPRRIVASLEQIPLIRRRATGWHVTVTRPAEALAVQPGPPGQLSWRPVVGKRGRLSLIRELTVPPSASGLRFEIRASAGVDQVRLRFRRRKGSSGHWSFPIERPHRWLTKTCVLDWLQLEPSDADKAPSTDRLEFLLPPDTHAPPDLVIRLRSLEWVALERTESATTNRGKP